ncbi:MAG: hypothetical protein HYU77_04925 [Betaproteobacteria bacterium]|nr:hypothetical protein [Betaproteobacteria bacterium]
MRKSLLVFCAAATIAVAGCQSVQTQSQPELPLDVQVALMQAEADVKLANSKAKDKAGPANKALEQAKEAAAKGDAATTKKYANTATAEALKAMK